LLHALLSPLQAKAELEHVELETLVVRLLMDG
jgi:hypothetical protein